jgi:hypothetical protein
MKTVKNPTILFLLASMLGISAFLGSCSKEEPVLMPKETATGEVEVKKGGAGAPVGHVIVENNVEGVTISFQQKIRLLPEELFIRFDDVKEDSRCPKGVQCIWAGNAQIAIEVYQENMEKIMFDLNNNRGAKVASYGKYKIHFAGLSPYPEANKTINKTEYKLRLKITQE